MKKQIPFFLLCCSFVSCTYTMDNCNAQLMKEHKEQLLKAIKEDRNIETIRNLLNIGIKPDEVIDKNGLTPLIHAVQNRRDDIVKELLAIGANPNTTFHVRGISPLSIAVFLDSEKIVKILLDYKADTNVYDDEGNTPLIISTEYPCNETIVQMLLDSKANPNAHNLRGFTPLLLTTNHEFDDQEKCLKQVAIVSMLLNAGANPNEDTGWGTPLSFTMQSSSIAGEPMANLLLHAIKNPRKDI